MEEPIDQNDQLQLPPGWGPIVFLAAVLLLSNVGLGLWMRSMMLNSSTSVATAGPQGGGPGQGGPGKQGGPGGQGGPGMQGGQGGQGGPGMQGGPGGQGGPESAEGPGAKPALLGPDGQPVPTIEVDDALFTPELDAKLRTVAQDHGLDPSAIPSGKQIFMQMQRSNLLPRNGDLDLETILTGHIMEMAKSGQAGPGQPGEPSPLGQAGKKPPLPEGITPGGPMGGDKPPLPEGEPTTGPNPGQPPAPPADG
jgi:hypothetical protein